MHKLLLILRTVCHLKPIQVTNRIWRKLLPKGVGRGMVAGDSAAARDGTRALPEFTFLNQTARPNGWNDPTLSKLWLYNLHYFDFLGEKLKCEVEVEQRKMELVLKWIAENPAGYGNGWEPYPISLRVVNWIKWLGMRGEKLKGEVEGEKLKCEVEGEVEVEGEGREGRESRWTGEEALIRRSLTEQVEWLSKRLEYHLLANHLLANAKALVFAGAFLGVEKWYRKGMAIYRKELPEQICADGVHFERSAMYHSIILEDVLDCFKLLGKRVQEFKGSRVQGEREFKSSRVQGERRFKGSRVQEFKSGVEVGVEVEGEEREERRGGEEGREEDRGFFRGYAERMLAGLKLLTGPDGKIVKFNDAADGIAKTPAELFAFAQSLDLKPGAPGSAGDSGFVRIERGAACLVAKCGPIGPDYQPGHAHADTGSFEFWKDGVKIVTDTGTDRYVIDAERKRQRGTAAHNTVMIDGRDSSEVWAGHRVARRAKSEGWSVDGATLALAYRDYRGFRIRRTLELADDGVRGTDEISGSGEHELELRWHFAPGKSAMVKCEPGEPVLESAMICEEFGRQSESHVAVLRLKTVLPTTVRWTILI